MSKSKNENPFTWVDGIEKKKPFMIISEKQAQSYAFISLSGDAVKLLVQLKICRKYYRGTEKNGISRAINGDPLCFYWNRELAERHGFNNPNKTLKSMRELVRYGFVDVLENNAHRHKKSLFRFDWKWQKIEQDADIELSDAAKTYLEPNRSKAKQNR